LIVQIRNGAVAQIILFYSLESKILNIFFFKNRILRKSWCRQVEIYSFLYKNSQNIIVDFSCGGGIKEESQYVWSYKTILCLGTKEVDITAARWWLKIKLRNKRVGYHGH
jgi:hypothetical protein